MRTFNSIYIIPLLILIALQFCSCERDRCKTRATVCLNNGTCNNGSCICPADFEGDSCQTAMNKKFENTFGGRIVFANGSLYPNGYFINDTIKVLAKIGDNLGISWTHRHAPITGITFNGKIANNEVTVDAFKAANGYTYKGTGSLNKDYFTITMQADSLLGGLPLKTYNYTFIGARTQ
jgi:hypothetical protein